MRTIKFRAWDGKIMYEPMGLQGDWQPYFRDEKIKDIMQYTGLKDKNGKEIYEGDIVRKDGEYSGLVEYVWDKFSLNIWYEDAEWEPFTDRWTEYGEVIGNRFENPELLK